MATTYNNLYLDLRTELRRAGDEEATQSARELVCAAAAKTREELVRILTEPKNAPVKQYEKLLAMDNVKLEFAEDALRAVAKKAIERKTGARSLKGIIEDVMLDVMYDIPKSKEPRKVIITKACINEGEKPEVIALDK